MGCDKWKIKLCILLIGLCTLSLSSGYKKNEHWNRYRRGDSTTLHVCEGERLVLDCRSSGGVLHIMRANYGRLTLGVCNPRGISDGWNTMCLSYKSFGIVSERCTGESTCSLIANNDNFGEPCGATFKYLEVVYQCVPVTTTTLPPPTVTSLSTKPTTTITTTSRRPITKRPKPPVLPKTCPSITMRDITWPETLSGKYSKQPCPNGMNGDAHYFCDKKWQGNPDLSKCVSAWVKTINSKIDGGEPVSGIALEIEKKTTKTDTDFYGGDLVETSKIMKKVVSAMKDELKTTSNHAGVETAAAVTNSIVKASSNLLSKNKAKSWEDLPEDGKKQVATNVIESVESCAIETASKIDEPANIRTTEDNIVVEVFVIETRKTVVQQLVFPESTHNQKSTKKLAPTDDGLNKDVIIIPASALKQSNVNGLAKVVFALYGNLGQYMTPVSRNGSDENGTNTIVNTKIISASLPQRTEANVPLSEPVIYRLQHERTEGLDTPRCAFWDYTNNPKNGHWSTDGCTTESHSQNETVCKCTHLTNFAVLMDVVGTKLASHHELSLTIITYAGCIVSIVCLLLCWITFQFFRNLQCDRNTIHKNLVGTLLLAEVIFLAGIVQFDKKILCAVIAGLLHFFFLAAFAWMCLEGVQLYVMLIEVFEAEKSRRKWYYLAGYGLPALVVSISAGVYPAGYGTEKHCWLSTENYFILAFVAPAAAVISVNVIMLSIAIYMMCRHANMAAKLKAKDRSRIQNARASSSSKRVSFTSTTMSSSASAEPVESRRRSDSLAEDQRRASTDAGAHRRSLVSTKSDDVPIKRRLKETVAWIKGASVLVVLLGLTWSFGLLFLGSETVALAYIFTILNSLQGLFIFTFHCIMNEKVQKEYKKCVRRTSWMPDCIRIGYGGHTGLSNSISPSRSSSNAGNYFARLWSSRIRKKSSSTSLPKSSAAAGIVFKNNHAMDPYSNGNYSTLTKQNNNGFVSDDGSLLDGDLSKIDGSIIDSGVVSDYCRNNMLVNKETGAQYNLKPKIPLNVKNELNDSYVGEFSESEFSDADLYRMTDYCDKRLLKDRDHEQERQNMLREESMNGDKNDDSDEDDGYEKVCDGYEEPKKLQNKTGLNRMPSDKNIINSLMNAQKEKSPVRDHRRAPSWSITHSDEPNHYDMVDPMRDNRQSTPNLKFSPPRQLSVTEDSLAFGRPDSAFLRSMPNLAFNNVSYEQDSTVHCDRRGLLLESFRLKRTGSDPRGSFRQTRHGDARHADARYGDASEC